MHHRQTYDMMVESKGDEFDLTKQSKSYFIIMVDESELCFLTEETM